MALARLILLQEQDVSHIIPMSSILLDSRFNPYAQVEISCRRLLHQTRRFRSSQGRLIFHNMTNTMFQF